MKILVATDGSEFSRNALEKASDLAEGKKGISFLVMSVYEPQVPIAAEPFAISAQFIENLDTLAQARAEESAKEAVAYLRKRFPSFSTDIEWKVAMGRPAQLIVEEAEKWEADLIVAGSHGHGFWGRLAVGSVSDSILHNAPCSVLIVRPEKVSTAELKAVA
ncbi:MAG TPA: universal stress protein [Pyrinomonadaceae bacterium]